MCSRYYHIIREPTHENPSKKGVEWESPNILFKCLFLGRSGCPLRGLLGLLC